MPRGYLSARIDDSNRLHHLWCNNGSWWVHYTVNFDDGNRTRRIRRSLKTSDINVAIARRDSLFATLQTEGEEIPERAARRRRRASDEERLMVGVGHVTTPIIHP